MKLKRGLLHYWQRCDCCFNGKTGTYCFAIEEHLYPRTVLYLDPNAEAHLWPMARARSVAFMDAGDTEWRQLEEPAGIIQQDKLWLYLVLCLGRKTELQPPSYLTQSRKSARLVVAPLQSVWAVWSGESANIPLPALIQAQVITASRIRFHSARNET